MKKITLTIKDTRYSKGKTVAHVSVLSDMEQMTSDCLGKEISNLIPYISDKLTSYKSKEMVTTEENHFSEKWWKHHTLYKFKLVVCDIGKSKNTNVSINSSAQAYVPAKDNPNKKIDKIISTLVLMCCGEFIKKEREEKGNE